MSRPPARIGLALTYAALFAVVGISQPFWPVYLTDRGLGPGTVGAVLAIQSLGRSIANPFWGVLADRTGERRRILLCLTLASFAGFWLFGVVEGAIATIVLAGLLGMIAPQGNMVDEMTTMAAKREGFDYGKVRLWGSVGFLATSIGAGQVLALVPLWAVLPMIAGAYGVAALAMTILPSEKVPGTRAPRLAAVSTVLKAPGMLLFLLVVGLIQNSHFVYYGFGALDWRAAGIDKAMIGALWAEGVIAEIVLFWFAGRLMPRVGAIGLLAVGGGTAVIRWLLMAASTDPAMLMVTQAMHALSFGASHLGAMRYLAEHAPSGLSATAQALHSALPYGVGGAIAYMLAGQLYGAFGGGAYLVAAAMALAALALLPRLKRFG